MSFQLQIQISVNESLKLARILISDLNFYNWFEYKIINQKGFWTRYDTHTQKQRNKTVNSIKLINFVTQILYCKENSLILAQKTSYVYINSQFNDDYYSELDSFKAKYYLH